MSSIGVGLYKLGWKGSHKQYKRAVTTTRLSKPAHRTMATLHSKV
jgi:hypothetical protein